MAKIVIKHDTDPAIEMELEEVAEGTPGRARGVRGRCTCGWSMHRWHRDFAIETAKAHVDKHPDRAADTDAPEATGPRARLSDRQETS